MSDSGNDAAGKTLADLKAVGDAVKQTGEQAKQAGADALGHAREVAQDVKARATSLAGTITEQASSVAETQKGNLADRLEGMAKAVHQSGEQLEGHQDWIAKLVERGADELGTLATTLRTNDLQSLLGELGSLARRQPALFVGASMAAGFALARVGRLAVKEASDTATVSHPDPAPVTSIGAPTELPTAATIAMPGAPVPPLLSSGGVAGGGS